MAAIKALLLVLILLNSISIDASPWSSNSSERRDKTRSKRVQSKSGWTNSSIPWREPTVPARKVPDDTFRVHDIQCKSMDDVFLKTKRTTILYVESCQARFIRMSRLFDGSMLVYISLKEWASGNRLQVLSSRVNERVEFNFAPASLVVRVDECEGRDDQVTVSVTPFPKDSPHGISVHISDYRTGSGEYLLSNYQLKERQCDLQITHSTSNCSLANSYLMLCARNRHSSCPVRLVKGETNLVECDCGSVRNFPLSTFHVMCLVLVVLLIGISCYSFGQPEEADGKEDEHMNVLGASGKFVYHYQAIYRVGCPTCKFDARSTLIDIELLGPNLEPIGNQLRYSLTDLTGTKLSTFICDIYVPKPLPKVSGVRVSHTRGFPGSGIFLFDVHLNLISGPKEMSERDEVNEDYLKFKPVIVDVNRIKNQRMKIFAYIVDSPRIYTNLDKGATVQLPPFAYPRVSHAFLKALFWLCCTQCVFLTIILLDLFFIKWPTLCLSFGAVLVISPALLLELLILSWAKKEISLQATKYELINGIFGSNSRKVRSLCNWSFYVNILLWLCLLAVIGILISFIGVYHEQSTERAYFIESIFVCVLAIVLGLSWVCYEVSDGINCLSKDRLLHEYDLMSDSNLRALEFSTSNKSTSAGHSTTSKSYSRSSPTTARASPQVKSVEGSYEMFSDQTLQ